MEIITSTTIDSWERFFRANFVNSLTGFKSVNLIGTADASGKTNLGIFSSIVHIGSNPPYIGYINRPVEAAPHTLTNIRETHLYTINHINPGFLEKAHQTSAKYPAEISEFDAVGLTPQYRNGITAPFVQESKVKYALELEEIVPIKWNNTFLVIGRVLCVLLEDEIIASPDGYLHLDKVETVCSNGMDGYYTTDLINRFTYAKPDKPVEKIR